MLWEFSAVGMVSRTFIGVLLRLAFVFPGMGRFAL